MVRPGLGSPGLGWRSIAMHLVIDSNQLQDDRLRRFLRQSQRNRAVLIDFLGIEAYNGDVANYFKWLDVLSEFPDQVLVLKGSATVVKLSGRPSGLIRRMIDEETTAGFASHVAAAKAARLGHAGALKQANELRTFAGDHLAKMEVDSSTIRDAMGQLGSIYASQERAIIQERGSYPKPLLDKLTYNLFSIAALMLGPGARGRSFERDIKNTLPFRAALAIYVLTLHRTAAGSVAGLKPAKLRNDLVDMMFVAYGTFFDGVLSADARVIDLYQETAILLFGMYDAHVAEGFNPLSKVLS